MKLLLDTHVWLWMVAASDRLHDDVKQALHDEGNDLFLSAAAVWEIGIKHAAGKLKFSGQPAVQVPLYINRSGVQPLVVTVEHALRAADLPPHHRDPFDRMIVAQAQQEEMTLVTADRRLSDYEVPLIYADGVGNP